MAEHGNYWTCVHWEHGPTDSEEPRGYFKLFVQSDFVEPAWDVIKDLTLDSQLGYLSAISPDAMSRGDHVGYFCICVHTYRNDETRVGIVLSKAGFASAIQSYENNYRHL